MNTTLEVLLRSASGNHLKPLAGHQERRDSDDQRLEGNVDVARKLGHNFLS